MVCTLSGYLVALASRWHLGTNTVCKTVCIVKDDQNDWQKYTSLIYDMMTGPLEQLVHYYGKNFVTKHWKSTGDTLRYKHISFIPPKFVT